MQILTTTALLPAAATTTPYGKLVIDLYRRDHDRALRDAARAKIIVQHHEPQAQIVGKAATLASAAYLLEPDDMRHLGNLQTAVDGGDVQTILTAAHELAAHLRGDAKPERTADQA